MWPSSSWPPDQASPGRSRASAAGDIFSPPQPRQASGLTDARPRRSWTRHEMARAGAPRREPRQGAVMTVDGVPGIADAPRLARWLSASGVASGELGAIELIAGGRSNLTYRLESGGSRLVLRRPPLGHVLPTAHDMATLGDPLADLGLTLIYWADPGDAEWLDINVGAAVTARPGFLSRAGLARRYAELTGRDLSGIGYYMAFGCFKLAVVLEGIHARFLQHKTVGEGFEREGPAVPVLIERAHQMLDTGLADDIG